MRGQSNLTPLRSKGKVMLGQVVVSLAQECLPSLCVCLCKTGSRTVTLVNTSTQASDSMGSWNVGDTGWWCFSWNRNRPAIISVFWHVEGRRFVQCWVSQLLLPVAAQCLYMCLFEFVYEDVTMTRMW